MRSHLMFRQTARGLCWKNRHNRYRLRREPPSWLIGQIRKPRPNSNCEALEKLPELLVRQASVADDVVHRDGIHGIVPRNADYARAVGHHHVLALSRNPKAVFLKCPNRRQVVDARQFRHDQTSTATCFAPAESANSWTTSKY